MSRPWWDDDPPDAASPGIGFATPIQSPTRRVPKPRVIGFINETWSKRTLRALNKDAPSKWKRK